MRELLVDEPVSVLIRSPRSRGCPSNLLYLARPHTLCERSRFASGRSALGGKTMRCFLIQSVDGERLRAALGCGREPVGSSPRLAACGHRLILNQALPSPPFLRHPQPHRSPWWSLRPRRRVSTSPFTSTCPLDQGLGLSASGDRLGQLEKLVELNVFGKRGG